MAIDKSIQYVEQDGVLNYIKNSKSVTVPKEFKARKNAPATKLAYITAEEAKMLKKMKKGTPHKGPKGIPSYDSFDAQGNFRSGEEMSAAERGDAGAFGNDPGARQEAQDIRSSVIAAGAGQRVNPGFFDSRNTVSPAELARAKAFNPTAFRQNRGGGIMNFITSGGLLGNLARSLGQRLGLGKKFNEPTYNMSQFNNLPLGGSAAFANLDIRDKFNRKNNFEIDPRLEDYLEFKQLSPDAITFEEYLENIENAPTGILQSSVLPNNNLIADATYDQQKNVLENILNTQDTGIGEFIEDKEQKDKRQQDLLNEILTG